MERDRVMKSKTQVNVGASVRARLLEVSKERHEDFTLMLMNYAAERFLYRLSGRFCSHRSRTHEQTNRSLSTGVLVARGRSTGRRTDSCPDHRERRARVKAAQRPRDGQP